MSSSTQDKGSRCCSNGWSVVILFGYIGSLFFFVYNSLYSCKIYSLPYLFFYDGDYLNLNKLESRLNDIIYYGLTADVFDAKIDWNNVKSMAALRDSCKHIFTNQFDIVLNNEKMEKKDVIIRYITNYLVSNHVFDIDTSKLGRSRNMGTYISCNSNILCTQCWKCFEKYYIKEYINELNKVSMYLNDNCRFDMSIGMVNEDTNNPLHLFDIKQMEQKKSEKKKQNDHNQSQTPSNDIMIVGASSAGLLSAISIAKSSFMGVPHLNSYVISLNLLCSVLVLIHFFAVLENSGLVTKSVGFNYPCANVLHFF